MSYYLGNKRKISFKGWVVFELFYNLDVLDSLKNFALELCWEIIERFHLLWFAYEEHSFFFSDNSEFCLNGTFTITTDFNNGAVACNCDTDGSLSFDCQNFGGQCTCRENVIGRKCTHCREGYYGFPRCKRKSGCIWIFFPKYVYVKFPFVHLRTNLSNSCPNLTYVANLNGYVIKLLPFWCKQAVTM